LRRRRGGCSGNGPEIEGGEVDAEACRDGSGGVVASSSCGAGSGPGLSACTSINGLVGGDSGRDSDEDSLSDASLSPAETYGRRLI
jgi:hypothetical protein